MALTPAYDPTVNNVRQLLMSLKGKITNEKQLLLAYWMKCDGVEMNKETIDTKSFLNKATDPVTIMGALGLLEAMEGRSLIISTQKRR